MQVQKKQLSETKVQLNIVADEKLLAEAKQLVLQTLSKQIKVAGFRQGKVPLGVVEKQADQSLLQSEFLDAAVNRVYVEALEAEMIRPVERPEVSIKKFVPFTTLELEATVEAVGKIKLADYKKIKLARKPVTITAKEIDEVIEALRERSAERKDVERAAKAGDEVTIDFAGRDAKTNEPIQGGDGKAYPLVLGSNSFIPGFEDNLVGMKAGEDKEFNITFPKDYGVSALQGRAVIFAVTAHKVAEMVKPKIDDEFAAKVGPVKTIADLKADIKKELLAERERQGERDYQSELLEKIAEKSEVAIPKVLIDEEIERLELDEKQNLAYRGQTWQEHLKEEGRSEEEHREEKRPAATNSVKAGLVLSEIAVQEGLTVTPEELEVRIQILKGQYQDKQMQAELDKPENRRDIRNRLLSEKTIQKLVAYVSTN